MQNNDLARVHAEKIRVLRQIKPEYFDVQGHLRSGRTSTMDGPDGTTARSSKK
jgi:hypothetical protein